MATELHLAHVGVRVSGKPMWCYVPMAMWTKPEVRQQYSANLMSNGLPPMPMAPEIIGEFATYPEMLPFDPMTNPTWLVDLLFDSALLGWDIGPMIEVQRAEVWPVELVNNMAQAPIRFVWKSGNANFGLTPR